MTYRIDRARPARTYARHIEHRRHDVHGATTPDDSPAPRSIGAAHRVALWLFRDGGMAPLLIVGLLLLGVIAALGCPGTHPPAGP